MPKEKATRGRSKRDGVKRRKGKFAPESIHNGLLIHLKIPTLPSAVFRPTCFSQMSSATRFGKRTRALNLVSPVIKSINVLSFLLMPSSGDVGKLLGERWKALSDKQRAPYESKAAADKKRYEEEKAAYANVSSMCFLVVFVLFNSNDISKTYKNPFQLTDSKSRAGW